MNEPPVFAIIAFPLIVGVLVCIAALCLRTSSFFSQAIAIEEGSARYHAIDGLRGLLAIGVFFHHSVITYYFYKTGVWTVPPSRLSTLLGQGGVAFFFMITAFLFWTRPFINLPGGISHFYWSRVRRLCPMYVVAAATVLITAMALTHFRLVVSFKDLVAQALTWITFTIWGTPDINGFKNTNVINGVFWTLVYEWKFYVLLPFLLVFKTGKPFVIAVAAIAIGIWLLAPDTPSWYFLGGVIAATLSGKCSWLRDFSRSMLATAITMGSLIAVYLTQAGAYNPATAALLFLPFVFIANGNTLLGILTFRPIRVLGLISYSFYLLHCTFLYLGFRLVARETSVAGLSPLAFWSIVCALGIVIVVSSMVTYRQVEYRYSRIADNKKPSGNG